MREGVAAGRGRAAQARERAAVQPETVANVVEAQAMSQLRIDQGNHVAPWTITAGLLVDAGRPSDLRDQVGRNQIANLLEDAELATRWLGVGFGFHTC